MVKIVPEEKRVYLEPNVLHHGGLLKKFEENKDKLSFIAMPEVGSWMLETTPNKPYYHTENSVAACIRSVILRAK